MGDTAASPPLCSPHDDDDGRGRAVQDQVEEDLEESYLW